MHPSYTPELLARLRKDGALPLEGKPDHEKTTLTLQERELLQGLSSGLEMTTPEVRRASHQRGDIIKPLRLLEWHGLLTTGMVKLRGTYSNGKPMKRMTFAITTKGLDLLAKVKSI